MQKKIAETADVNADSYTFVIYVGTDSGSHAKYTLTGAEYTEGSDKTIYNDGKSWDATAAKGTKFFTITASKDASTGAWTATGATVSSGSTTGTESSGSTAGSK